MKLINTSIHNSIADHNLGQLMRNIEVLEIFKQKQKDCALIYIFLIIKEFCSELPIKIIIKNSNFLGGGGEILAPTPSV